MVAKRIYLMITSYFPTPEMPWNCVFTYEQTRTIAELSDKYEVVVLRPDRDGEYDFKGIRVIGFKYHLSGAWLCPWLVTWINVSRMWRTLQAAGILVEDIAVAHGHLAPMAAYVNALKEKNRTIKAVLQFHDADPYGMLLGNGVLRWYKKIVYFLYHRTMVEKMDLLVAISKNVARVVEEAPRQGVYNAYEPMKRAMYILRRFRRARLSRPVYVLHNGVDRNVFFPRPKTQRGVFTIGCVGVFRDLKDQITLLRAARELLQYEEFKDRLRVKLVGADHSGAMLEDCRAFIRDNRLPAEIIAPLTREKLADFYRSIDLFVLPSYFEGFGCVLTEAWCCGTPFMTCEGQGAEDVIPVADRGKWFFRAKDWKQLAGLIKRYVQDSVCQKLVGELDIRRLIVGYLQRLEEFDPGVE